MNPEKQKAISEHVKAKLEGKFQTRWKAQKALKSLEEDIQEKKREAFNAATSDVRGVIKAEVKASLQRAKVVIDDVVEGLLREARREDEEGGSSGNRISAWVQIGRHLGMFQDRVKVEVTDDLSPERRAMILALVQQTLVVAGPAIEYAAEVIDIDGEDEDAE
jgi:hypothetical protein